MGAGASADAGARRCAFDSEKFFRVDEKPKEDEKPEEAEKTADEEDEATVDGVVVSQTTRAWLFLVDL